MNFSAVSVCASRPSISRSSASSPAQAFSKKARRSLAGSSSAAWHKSSSCFQRSASIPLLLTELAQQPKLGQPPIPMHRLLRYLQDFRRLLHAQSAVEAQFNHLGLTLVHGRQSLES